MKSYTITVNGNVYADLPDPVLGKGVSGEIGLPLRLRQQLRRQQHRQVAQEMLRLRQEQQEKYLRSKLL